MRKYLYAFNWDCTHEDFIIRIFHAEDLTLAYEGWTETMEEHEAHRCISEFETEEYTLERIKGAL